MNADNEQLTLTTQEIALSLSRSERTVRRMIHSTKDPDIIKKLEDSWFTKKQPEFTHEEVRKIIKMRSVSKRINRHNEIGKIIKTIERQIEYIKTIYAEEDAIIRKMDDHKQGKVK